MDDNALIVMPMSQELDLEPGSTYTGTITVANPQSATSDLTYTATVSPYSVSGSSYTADLSGHTSYTQLADWITLENNVGTMSPNGTVEIKYTIKVPQDADPGGQYAAVRVASTPDSSSTSGISIGNSYEMASIIYANIAGEVHREGSVTSQSIPSFITSSEFTSTATVVNNGNTHEDALVTFKITNAMNGGVIYPQDKSYKGINEIIMPDTTRDLTYTFDHMPAVGIINVNQTIEYNGETYSLDQSIFICPVWFMVLIGALIISVASLIAARIHRSRRRKRISSL